MWGPSNHRTSKDIDSPELSGGKMSCKGKVRKTPRLREGRGEKKKKELREGGLKDD